MAMVLTKLYNLKSQGCSGNELANASDCQLVGFYKVVKETGLEAAGKMFLEKYCSCCDRSVNCFFKPSCDIKRITFAAVLAYDNVKIIKVGLTKKWIIILTLSGQKQVTYAVLCLHAV